MKKRLMLIIICVLPLWVAGQFNDSAQWSVTFANVNSGYDEGNPVVWNRGLAFVSNRGRTAAARYTDHTTNDYFWRMWYVYDSASVKSDTPVWKKEELARPAAVRETANDSRRAAATRPPAAMPGNLRLLTGDKVLPFRPNNKKRYHEGPFCFNSRQDTMYLTGNFPASRKQKGRLLIQTLTYRYGDWIPVNAFPYNNPAWSCAHPALHPDGNLLVFVSDMPGGTGGKDIWFCQRTDTGWAAPQNAGPGINSAGNEAFPAFGPDGTLYFSSDRPGGAGGLDLYRAQFVPGGNATAPAVLPAPVNSPSDDFGIWMAPGGRFGYITSNRYGSDDILRITSTY